VHPRGGTLRCVEPSRQPVAPHQHQPGAVLSNRNWSEESGAGQADREKLSQDEFNTQGGNNVTLEALKSSVAGTRSTIAANKSYRCYFTDIDDRIQSYEQIECENDAEAALRAQELLAASRFTSAEIWQGRRIVGKWGNIGVANPRRQANADSST
jgi:hypothetical protein